jgi:hypothetical protein
MIQLLVILACMWLGPFLSQAAADQPRSADLPLNPGIPKLPPIAGVPYHEALLILERHRH